MLCDRLMEQLLWEFSMIGNRNSKTSRNFWCLDTEMIISLGKETENNLYNMCMGNYFLTIPVPMIIY